MVSPKSYWEEESCNGQQSPASYYDLPSFLSFLPHRDCLLSVKNAPIHPSSHSAFTKYPFWVRDTVNIHVASALRDAPEGPGA